MLRGPRRAAWSPPAGGRRLLVEVHLADVSEPSLQDSLIGGQHLEVAYGLRLGEHVLKVRPGVNMLNLLAPNTNSAIHV